MKGLVHPKVSTHVSACMVGMSGTGVSLCVRWCMCSHDCLFAGVRVV